MEQRRKAWLRWLALAAGVLLTGAALVIAARGVDWSQLTRAEPWQIAVLLAAVVGNLLVTAVIFWVITLSFDAQPRVPLLEMFWLITASALLNYLPLRPGLLGRAAYLKLKYGLPLKQSVVILLVVMVLGAGVLMLAGAVALALDGARLAAGAVVAGVLITALAWGLAPVVLRRPVVAAWSWVPLRLVDLAFATVRLWVAFAVIGYRVDPCDVLVCAAVGMVVAMAGLTPNGLGLREWAIAGTAGVMAGAIGTGDPAEAASIAAAAALIDRAAEAVVVGIVGAVAMRQIGGKLQAGAKQG